MNGILILLFSFNSESASICLYVLHMRIEKFINRDRVKLSLNNWSCLCPSGTIIDESNSEMHYSDDYAQSLMRTKCIQFANEAVNIIQNPTTAWWVSFTISW